MYDRCVYTPEDSAITLPRGAVTVIDVGANIGLFTLWALAEAPTSRVIAIEPAPATFALLGRNLRAASADTRVSALMLGVGSEIRRGSELTYYPRMPGNSTFHPEEKWAQRRVFARREAVFDGARRVR